MTVGLLASKNPLKAETKRAKYEPTYKPSLLYIYILYFHSVIQKNKLVYEEIV